MFARILIANRGEIACRVALTARRLDIATVAVYSDADAKALHVRACDESVRIGPPPARDSYLRIDAIIDAALQTGAQAIHPGYGFLSENAQFAEACARAGLVFIGPPPAAMRAMGDKSAAKTLMERAGLPLVPGYHGDDQTPGFLEKAAARIGYPVMIKASAGGGGKGMRIVHRADEFAALLASCQREAAASFGDDRVLMEKYVERPRHIEMQVFADTFGHCVHLFERDCSVQRRHQKVLEEAPAPRMTADRRRRMGEAAVAAARAVGYVGAGTVEFIASREGDFHFMEMNTRLQVEHPVTEMITGLDLVEWQLRVAAGEALPLEQQQLSMDGHAMEARIYAEDPANGFLPSIGRLHYLAPPPESRHVRLDTGVQQGDEITPWYDPLIAKLIVWDTTRDLARMRLREALEQYRLVGVANNVEFLSRIASNEAFAAGDLDTGLIERESAALLPADEQAPAKAWLIAALAGLQEEKERPKQGAPHPGARHSPWQLHNAWRLNGPAMRRLRFRDGTTEKTLQIYYTADAYLLELDEVSTAARVTLREQSELHVELGDEQLDVTVVAMGETFHVLLEGRCHRLTRVAPLDHAVEETVAGDLRAPMPGRIVALLAEPGAVVEKGAPLMVLEAMKMEYTVTAPSKGTVKAFHYSVGDQTTLGAVLIDFEPAD